MYLRDEALSLQLQEKMQKSISSILDEVLLSICVVSPVR